MDVVWIALNLRLHLLCLRSFLLFLFLFFLFFIFFILRVLLKAGDNFHCSSIVHETHRHFIQKKNIKNGSYDTIHTFKNYFVTVFSIFNFQFSVFSFSNNKFNPNGPIANQALRIITIHHHTTYTQLFIILVSSYITPI